MYQDTLGLNVEEPSETVDIPAANVKFESDLLTLTFGKKVQGNHMVDMNVGVTALRILDTISDTIVVRIAEEIRNIFVICFGENDFYHKKTPPVMKMFENGKLMEQYALGIDESNIPKVEGLFAAAVAKIEMLISFANQRDLQFPHLENNGRAAIQYAWNTETRAKVTDLADAIKYRLYSGLSYKAIEINVKRRETTGSPMLNATNLIV